MWNQHYLEYCNSFGLLVMLVNLANFGYFYYQQDDEW